MVRSSEPAAPERPSVDQPLDAESARWVQSLSAEPDERDEAVTELHALLIRVATAEAGRRAGTHGVRGPELSDLAHQAAGDAVVSILRRLADFRGESRFTTWACKFVILEVASKLTRHVWRRDRVQLDPGAWGQLPARLGSGPADLAESQELVDAVREGVESALTPHQRRIFVAIIVDAVPLDVLAAELGSNRNAIYKTMFDARRKLRAYLVAAGAMDADGRHTP